MLVSIVEVHSQVIGVEFSIKKCGVIIYNREKVKSTDGIELLSGEKIKYIYIYIYIFIYILGDIGV